ncbi:ATP13A2 [Blepharisma stoltei]|uniref:P-type ATPase A domain-containing protein n=1 Tax=Blepharisma stoltei TaxID=1481888 RepID=A0AAU9JCI0_9CILI|nr:unnamed protein product [Blepharisma stoltei]
MEISDGKEFTVKSPLIPYSDSTFTCTMHIYANEESLIQKIESFKLTFIGNLFYWFLVIITLGIYFLFDKWFIKLHLRVRYKRSPPNLSTHFLITTKDFTNLVEMTLKHSKTLGDIITFTHHDLSYYFDGKCFQPLYFNAAISYSSIIDRYSKGYSDGESIQEMQSLFGLCQIEIPLKSFFRLVYEEGTSPFYIFQIFSITIWMVDDYILYSCCIILLTCISLFSSAVQTRKSMLALHEIALKIIKVKVLRQGNWTVLDSANLVPGDVIEIPQQQEMPCDTVLISGSCIIDEASLTGESIPVIKDNLPYLSEHIYSIEGDRHYSLYEGTKVIQTRNYGQGEVIGIVTRIGYATMKGKMIRSILYPKPNKFKFYEDAIKFIGVLAIISILGFIICMPIMIYRGVPIFQIIIHCFDLFTEAIPPALPACMTICTAISISRLRKQGIFCTAPQRVNVAGRIDTFCFDKTGTLTEDGMDLLGVHPNIERSINLIYNDSSLIINSSKRLIECMAACHSLIVVDGKLLGDSQDIQIFNFTRWSMDLPLAENQNSDVKFIVKSEKNEGELGVLRTFHFTSKLKRMGAIVKSLADGQFIFYMKGAPEVVLEKCNPESIPANLAKILSGYTCSGYRVLACAYKFIDSIDNSELNSKHITDFESDLELLGLIILQNKLKSQTIPAIQVLHEAGIRTIMATGDAILTGISVARECSLIDSSISVYLGELREGKILWELFGVEKPLESHTIIDHPWKSLNDSYTLAMTGAALSHLIHLSESGDQDSSICVKNIIEKCKVFARMSPDHKSLLMEKYQQFGKTIGMCGDGANDCGALKTADIGISLSEAESSIAAPFTSKIPDISCVINVLREGRCSLVSSVQCFKYMALYAMITFISLCILYSVGTGTHNNQFLVYDLITVMPLAIAMTYTKACNRLSKKQPISALISVSVLSSVIGQILLETATQAAVYLIASWMPFFEKSDYERGEDLNEFYYSYPNTVIFLTCWMQMEMIALVFNVGGLWKKPFYTNFLFTGIFIFLVAATTYSIVYPADWVRDVLNLKDIPEYFRLILLGICAIYAILAYILELALVPWIEIAWFGYQLKRKKISNFNNNNIN